MRKSFIAIMCIAPLILGGCTTNGNGVNKSTAGGVLGGALGGLLGSQFGGGTGKLAMTAGGAVLGMLLGHEVGQSLDRADKLSVQQATYRAVAHNPAGHAAHWRNSNGRTYGKTVAGPAYRNSRYPHVPASYCREYQQDITVNGKTQRGYGKACRQPDGSWKISNS